MTNAIHRGRSMPLLYKRTAQMLVAMCVGVTVSAWAETIPATGDIVVPPGEVQTLTDASGSVTVKGGGCLIVDFGSSGSSGADVTFTVTENSSLQLRDTCGRVGDTTIENGSTLTLLSSEQIRDDATILIEGTFDLNGHSESVARMTNIASPLDGVEEVSAVIVNGSAAAGKLTSSFALFARVEKTAGDINLETFGADNFILGPEASVTGADVVTVAEKKSAGFYGMSDYSDIRIDIEKTWNESVELAVSEVQFTYKGVPVPASAIQSVYADGKSITKSLLFDDNSSTRYLASQTGAVSLKFVFNGRQRIDGYRIATATDPGRAPASWKVWGGHGADYGVVLLDVREDVIVSTYGRTYSDVFSFNSASRSGSVFGGSTEVTLGGSSADGLVKNLRVSTVDPLVTGAVTGQGGVVLEYGSIIAPHGLNGYLGFFSSGTLSSSTIETMAGVQVEGSEPQRVPVSQTLANANIRISNGGTSPTAVLIDQDSLKCVQRGRLSDGAGPMGLVKRGASVSALETEDCDNTGATVIEEGVLRVQGARLKKTITTRYVRILATETWGDGVQGWTDTTDMEQSASGYNWAMNEFQLLDAEGAVVDQTPKVSHQTKLDAGGANTKLSNLVDGNSATRCLVYNASTTKTAAPKNRESAWVELDYGESGVTFCGYQWYTPHGNAYDSKRTPTRWVVSYSSNGTDWEVAHQGEAAWVKDSTAWGSGTSGLCRGPFACSGASSSAGGCAVKTIDSQFLVADDPRMTRASALKARYFRFRPFATTVPQGGRGEWDYGWQLAEISLYRQGQFVEWKNAVVSVTGADVPSSYGSQKEKLANNVRTGALSGDQERCYASAYPSYVVIDAGADVEFDGWGFTTAATDGALGRVPVDFDFSVSADGTTWQVVTSVVGYEPDLSSAYLDQGPWSVADIWGIPGRMELNRIGDDSPVSIAAGATLQIAAEYERIGPVSGAGTLDVDANATVDIKTKGNSVFGGRVAGCGTLILSGEGAQTFDEVDLSAVTSLEFDGGAFGGKASFGALHVLGKPKFLLPEGIGASGGYSETVITAESIDSVSQELIRQAEFLLPDDFPRGFKAKIDVSDTTVKLSAYRNGMMLIFR